MVHAYIHHVPNVLYDLKSALMCNIIYKSDYNMYKCMLIMLIVCCYSPFEKKKYTYIILLFTAVILPANKKLPE